MVIRAPEGYIIPAAGIFENIRQICGAIDIRLPLLEESLVQASRRGYTKVVKSLSERLPSLDESLYQAASYGNIEFVKVLLNLGADVHNIIYPKRDANPAAAGGSSGRTALQAAAENGHIKIVEMLLQKGADINDAAGSFGRTALQAAAENGHIKIVEMLLQKGADISAAAGSFGRTALQAAAEKGHIEIVEMLLQKGADVKAGRTALQAAAERGHIKIVEILKQAEALSELMPTRQGIGSYLAVSAPFFSSSKPTIESFSKWPATPFSNNRRTVKSTVDDSEISKTQKKRIEKDLINSVGTSE